MSFFRYPFKNKIKTANLAKDRLQILLTHNNAEHNSANYLPVMRDEILQVISRYVDIDAEDLRISIDERNGIEILELNLILN